MHQTMRWIVGAGLLALAALSGSAIAQNPAPNSPSSGSPGTAAGAGIPPGVLPAPVGHRQPKASDIPSDAGRAEGRVDPARRDLDAKLRICKGC